ncbi:DUF2917 domain-containing protein [Myxococcaceae bacterium GXIMD 01537]
MATATLRGLWRAVRRPRHGEAVPGRVELEEGTVWSHRLGPGGLRISCCEGLLWLTREGDVRDTVLRAGESTRVEGRGLVVVQALRGARFSARPDEGGGA